MSFDLNTLIRDTLSRSREADPHVIARRLSTRIPDEHVREALADVLGDRVRIEIGRQRMHAASLPALSTGPSWRKQAANVLRQRVHVPGAGWKVLGDCTAEDCELIADDHAQRAVEQATLAERYRAYARLLREQDALTLSDLGAESLRAAA